ncbi:hypothetical protein WJX72_005037 [[Myrmecia] bisecta]|uniref:SAP domain-containing protein n=1 Tax=[Myrmecia] bisecta TaxID=41462 RepID=A0AAW1R6D1_9CHLO
MAQALPDSGRQAQLRWASTSSPTATGGDTVDEYDEDYGAESELKWPLPPHILEDMDPVFVKALEAAARFEETERAAHNQHRTRNQPQFATTPYGAAQPAANASGSVLEAGPELQVAARSETLARKQQRTESIKQSLRDGGLLSVQSLLSLKVTDLRAELERRGGSTVGRKAALVERLEQMLAQSAAPCTTEESAAQADSSDSTSSEEASSSDEEASRSDEEAIGMHPQSQGDGPNLGGVFVGPAEESQRGFATIFQPDEVASMLAAAHTDDVCILDVRGACDFTDYMVLATGRSHQHIHAAASAVLYQLKQRGTAPVPGLTPAVEGEAGADWLVVDAGSIVVHVFLEEARTIYDLEGLWAQDGSKIRQILDLGWQVLQRHKPLQLLELARAAVPLKPLPAAPAAWHALADGAVLGPESVHKALHRRRWRVPDVEGCSGCRCQLTTYPYGRRFRNRHINIWLAELFQSIPPALQAAGLPAAELSRFDLFHAHLFLATGPAGMGLLFHSAEFPAMSDAFPANLGFCQVGSPLAYEERKMDLRNLLWYQDQMWALDVGTGSALHTSLLMEGLELTRTVYEGDFGQPIADINYFHSLKRQRPSCRVYIC